MEWGIETMELFWSMNRLQRTAKRALLVCALLAPHASAHDAPTEEAMRQFLLKHPEVIVEALSRYQAEQEKAALAARIAALPDLFNDPPQLGIGNPDAPTRVAEFFDYRCAPCKAMHPGLVALVEAAPDLRIEMRHLPILSPGSERAARFALGVAEVAGAGAHQRVHDRLWALPGPFNAGLFERIAQEEGLDYAAIAEAAEGEAVSQRITRNRDIAIALEIRGTPAFVSPTSLHVGQSDIAPLRRAWLNR